MQNYRYVAIALATLGIVISTLYNDLIPNEMFLMGICMGVLFMVLAGTLTKRWLNRSIKLKDLAAGEEILLEEGSTYFKKYQSESGKLFLTNRRLVFYGKGVFRPSTTRITLKKSQIRMVAEYNRAMLPTGFQVKDKDGTVHAFAVDDRAAWIEKLK